MDSSAPRNGETLDSLARGGIRLIQPRNGFRVSLDPLLLADFATLKPGERVADLGTGSAVIPLLLASRHTGNTFVGIEREEEAAQLARRNVAHNHLDERVAILQQDLRTLAGAEYLQTFDVATSNPPYRPPGSGRIAPQPGRAAGRHELHGDLGDFLAAARYLLKNGGRLYLIYLSERLAELLAAMRGANIEPKRLRLIHSRSGACARLVLVEGRRAGRSGGLEVLPPLYIYTDTGVYTEEVRRILEGGGA